MRSHLTGGAGLAALVILFLGQAALAAEEITVCGRLGRTVEAGGWLVNAPKQKYLLLNADRWRNESWFREGAEVEATGEVRSDVMTTQMEGTPFQARTLRPVGGGSAAETRETSGVTRVVVTGDSVVQAQPDTAVVNLAVVTQARTAVEAQQENARKSDAVMRAVKGAAGAGAEVKTSGYSLQPQYAYREGQPPLIRGYEARNTVTVTTGELNRVGGVIDVASTAGATNVDSLAFTLRRDRPARDQALAEATREALSKAQVVAQALGGRVANIFEVAEVGAIRPPIPIYAKAEASMGRAAPADAVQTPIEIGTLEIRSQVQVVAEIMK